VSIPEWLAREPGPEPGLARLREPLALREPVQPVLNPSQLESLAQQMHQAVGLAVVLERAAAVPAVAPTLGDSTAEPTPWS
jgi:hypothetical protein